MKERRRKLMKFTPTGIVLLFVLCLYFAGVPVYGIEVEAIEDIAAPKILSAFPFDSDTNVDPKCHIYANFDRDMDASSINLFSFTVSDEKSEISGKVFYNREEKKAVFLPDFPLEWGMTYQASLGNTIKDTNGKNLESDKIWLFTVRVGDYIHPSLVSSSPAPDQRKAGVTKSTVLLFSEPLSKKSINNDSVTISENGNIQVPSRVVFEENSNQIEMIPRVKLKYDTMYTVKVNKYISDLSGNILLREVSFEYFTRPKPDVTPPKLIKTMPYDGASFTDIDVEISALFNEPLNLDNIDAFTVVIK
ncbi:Ig-like domain-containing protein, partial [bacterium]|nr:Ig-like domain-containing protein [bacterium]